MTRILSDREVSAREQQLNDYYTDERIREREMYMATSGHFARSHQYIYERDETVQQIITIDDDIPVIHVIEDKDPMCDIRDEALKAAYQLGIEDRIRIRTFRRVAHAIDYYTPSKAQEWRHQQYCGRDAIRREIDESRYVQDRWDEAVDWAISHGAKIRRTSKGVNRNTLTVRVWDAGLTEEWNAAFPEYAINRDRYRNAKVYLAEREEYYAGKKNHRKKRDA